MLGSLATLAPRLTRKALVDPGLLMPDAVELPRVIIAGFGRVGQTVAAMLDVHKVRYVAIDATPTGWRGSGRRASRCILAT